VWQRPASGLPIEKGQPALPPGSRADVKFQSGLMRSGSVAVDVDVTGAQALLLVATDAGNGANFDWADWCEPRLSGPQGEVRLTDLPWVYATTGYGEIQFNKSVVEKPLRLGDKTFANGIGTHANSVLAYLLPPGANRFRAVAGPDTGATEQPKTETSLRIFVIAGDRSLVEARASLALADPLMRALDRPNREQVVTERATVATTLQALELTNGQTLTGMLEQGARRWTRDPDLAAPTLVQNLYVRALGRPPTPDERQAAVALVGAPVRKEGVEDLLWALVMLPEFQLIY
jgi:hypothetical protein